MRAIQRTFATPLTFPWKFKQSTPPFDLKEVPPVLASQLGGLHEGFAHASKFLIESLSSHDYRSLERVLEPRLYAVIQSSLTEFEKQALRLKPLNPVPASVKLYNFSAAVGVVVNRSKNLAKERFMMINSFEDMLPLLKSMPMLNSLPLDNSLLKHLTFYLSPGAPASVCLAVDVVVRGLAPLSAVSHSVDMIYSEPVEELHVFKFESDKLIEASQSDLSRKMGMTDIMKYATQQAEGLFSGSWTITDIDNAMQGNPYVS